MFESLVTVIYVYSCTPSQHKHALLLNHNVCANIGIQHLTCTSYKQSL